MALAPIARGGPLPLAAVRVGTRAAQVHGVWRGAAQGAGAKRRVPRPGRHRCAAQAAAAQRDDAAAVRDNAPRTLSASSTVVVSRSTMHSWGSRSWSSVVPSSSPARAAGARELVAPVPPPAAFLPCRDSALPIVPAITNHWRSPLARRGA